MKKEKEALSLKNSNVSSNDYKDKVINVEYVSKKENKQISTSVNIP